MAHALPPLDGSLPTLLDYVDFHERQNGQHPWLVFPEAPSSSVVASISFGEMARASHRVAHWLLPSGASEQRETVAIIAHIDEAIYVSLILGLWRAGVVPYPMSYRNTPEDIVQMLRAAKCHRLLFADTTSELARSVHALAAQDAMELKLQGLPVLEGLFPTANGKPAANEFSKHFTSRRFQLHEVALYMHSSGSTGTPKTVSVTARQLVEWIKSPHFVSCRTAGIRFASVGLPTFHLIGLATQVCYPLCSGRAAAVYTPQFPQRPLVPHPQSIYEVSKLTSCAVLTAPPAFIEVSSHQICDVQAFLTEGVKFWSKDPEAVKYLQSLRVLVYGGGPLSHAVGNQLAALGVRIESAYGATEFGSLAGSWDTIFSARTPAANQDWEWIRLPADRVRWEPQGDGLYELVVQETPDYTLSVWNIPGERAYATGDLFSPHETQPDLWKIVGRKDDVLTLSTGFKVVPLQQEGRIVASPLVQSCVMFGRGRPYPGILLEPSASVGLGTGDDTSAINTFIDKIWPTVKAANTLVAVHARIRKDMVLIAHAERPLPRSGKGTVIRQRALTLYADEIEQLYDTLHDRAKIDAPPSDWTTEGLVGWLTGLAESLIPIATASLSPSVTLFEQGLDSLTAIIYRNRIVAALQQALPQQKVTSLRGLSSIVVFEHPTIHQLSQLLQSIESAGNDSFPHADGRHHSLDVVESMVQKYTSDLPVPLSSLRQGSSLASVVVLLVGSTGSVGSHTLKELLDRSEVQRVYTLDRPGAVTVSSRQRNAFSSHGISMDALNDPRLVALTGSPCLEFLGLERHIFEQVSSSVTHIIHVSWLVNFSAGLLAFEEHILGVRRLVDLCAHADHAVRLLVASSASVGVGIWDEPSAVLPETPLSDARFCRIGYSESKYVLEKMLDAAAGNGLEACSIRMEQACGSHNTGAWSIKEWFPAIVKSSQTLGSIPHFKGRVAWVPLDLVGNAFADIALSTERLPSLVNLVHPHPTSWDAILHGINAHLGGNLPIVPVEEWIDKIQAIISDSTYELLETIFVDVLRLFPTYMTDGNFGTTSAAADVEAPQYRHDHLLVLSQTMQGALPLCDEHISAWIRYWRKRNYIA